MTSILPLSLSPSNPSDSLSALTQTLDDLLERYLILLDQFQTLQYRLSQTLSSGYLSLAQANFQSPNHARYGQDFYDDRMQASTRISINSSSNTSQFSLLTPSSPQGPAAELLLSTGESPLLESSSSSSLTPRDPLTWFGILVPPALRQAQDSFKLVPEEIAPQLASIALQMKEVEIKVRRARKKMGKMGKIG